MADKDSDEILEEIQRRWREPRWEEPALLALGYYGSHSRRQFNVTIEKLFSGLESYQPSLTGDKITLYGKGSPNVRVEWISTNNPEAAQTVLLRELLFAGQVIAQVAEVDVRLRKVLIGQLLVTASGARR